MTKEELNAAIATHFGFQQSNEDKYLINGRPQWRYPNDWYLSQGGTPNIDVPDFLRLMEDYLELLKKHEFGGPMEYFGRLGSPTQSTDSDPGNQTPAQETKK